MADDNADISDSMSMLLQLRGYLVATAYDGAAAVELASSFQPEVALLDIGMPRLNGYDAARQIRSILGPHVLLVAVTAWGRARDKELATAAGFHYHFAKPVDIPRLFQLLSEWEKLKLALAPK